MIANSEWILLEPWIKEVTGMQMDSLSLNIEVGEYPKIKIDLHINSLIRDMSKEELEKLISYGEKRLKCLT